MRRTATIKQLYQKWLILAKKFSTLQIKTLFSFFYYMLVTPIGFIIYTCTDFLRLKNSSPWKRSESPPKTLDEMRKLS